MLTTLYKMPVRHEETVRYTLWADGGGMELNPLLGQRLSLRHTGRIFCTSCGKQTKKSFGNGFCYPCFVSAPEAAACIVRPELCQAHLGLGRDQQWERDHHLQPHVVYLALSSGLKVGVTRTSQVPTRWIDQGAEQAIVIASVPYRQLAGAIEMVLKASYNDKTNWQAMLKGLRADDDLVHRRIEAIDRLPDELKPYADITSPPVNISFPLLDVPKKVTSMKFDTNVTIGGVLTGIKGQYLIFDNQMVLNIRNHSGYEVEVVAG
jgi:hypothetical protein